MIEWATDALFYHIYPLGFCGAPRRNDFVSERVPRLATIAAWLPHIRDLGATALYLGPLFESTEHGYDTSDYRQVDRRLGGTADLVALSEAVHRSGLKLVFDAVFNHVGRDYPPFRDLQRQGRDSPYLSWFEGLDFSARSPLGDPFAYEGWRGHQSLVKLRVKTPEVREELFGVLRFWIEEFGIDGLRLDAADCLDFGFLGELAVFCRKLKPDFWLLGEVIHGDYGNWIRAGLDSVTNYEAYKGLWSSHNDGNCFEIAHTLNRQFGEAGIYRGMDLYSFADNHDVDRIASVLANPAHLYPLHILLFTMPGVPSLYYGSEWGVEGRKRGGSDEALRPALELGELERSPPQPDLPPVLRRLAGIRRDSPALRRGDYRQLHVASRQLAYARRAGAEEVFVAINTDDRPVRLRLPLPHLDGRSLEDLLNPGEGFVVSGGGAELTLHPSWGRVLTVR